MRHLAKRARRRARVAKLHNEWGGGGLDSSLGDACAQEPSGGAAWKLVAGAWPRHCGECSNGMLRHATTAHNNMMRRLGLQSAADSEGRRQGGMRLPWPDARVAVWPESLRRGNRSEQRKGAGLGGYRAP
jgi:hypothetical protein